MRAPHRVDPLGHDVALIYLEHPPNIGREVRLTTIDCSGLNSFFLHPNSDLSVLFPQKKHALNYTHIGEHVDSFSFFSPHLLQGKWTETYIPGAFRPQTGTAEVHPISDRFHFFSVAHTKNGFQCSPRSTPPAPPEKQLFSKQNTTLKIRVMWGTPLPVHDWVRYSSGYTWSILLRFGVAYSVPMFHVFEATRGRPIPV